MKYDTELRLGSFILVLLSVGVSHAQPSPAEQARSLVGPTRGLIVHVGCETGELTAALRLDEACLVHGIDCRPEKVVEARKHIRSLGLYGAVSVEAWIRPCMPYIDSTVNLIVAEDVGPIPESELIRVLVPGGVLLRKTAMGWSRTVKPKDPNTDEWTHYRHDASGNAVARDTVVGPPRHLQWSAGPGHTRAHEFTPSLTSLVSSGGRLFYVQDEGPVHTIQEPASWHLVARDAYNGLLLWKRPLPDWFSHLVGWTSVPQQLNRKLVAHGDRVYITLGFHAPLSALDATNGKTLLEFKDSAGADEILLNKGILVVVKREVTSKRLSNYRELLKLANQSETPLAERDSARPFIQTFRKAESQAPCSILAFDAFSGQEKWHRSGSKTQGLKPLTICTFRDHVFYQQQNRVIALDLSSGNQIWSVPAASLQLACDAGIVCLNKETLELRSREDGSILWSQPSALVNIRDVFAVNKALWIGGFKPFDTGTRWSGPNWGPYFAQERDLATGRLLREVNTGNPGHHQRCYDSAATDRYLLTGRRGTEYIDLDTGDISYHSWARGVCRYGVMPANGLLYVPPHECGCYVMAKLIGFNALAPERPKPEGRGQKTEDRLEAGPAYTQIINHQSSIINEIDWPTFRGDAARSGVTRDKLPDELNTNWQVSTRTTLTAPTVVEGKVFVATPDRHEILALDLASGKEVWRFTANGPVDSPPTAHAGQVLFGCGDGWVYALRATDGALVWRFQATRDPRRLVVEGHLESPCPVPGSVLVINDEIWCTVGRSSFLDGGIDLLRLDLKSGTLLSEHRIHSPDPETGAQRDPLEKKAMGGSRMDILSASEGKIFLQDRAFTLEGKAIEGTQRHLFAATGFLDQEWVHRSYYMVSEKPMLKLGSGWDPTQEMVFGRLLSVDRDIVYGYGRKKVDWSNEFMDGVYRFFARDKDIRKETFLWEQPSSIRTRAMIVTQDKLFAAGYPNKATKGQARLVSLSKADGKLMSDISIPSEPVLNGMAAARGQLVLTLENGDILCMGKTRD